MRKHRMFHVGMITDDTFTSLSANAQLLYLRLIAVADDDGFVGNVKMFKMRKTYLTELISCGYLHQFDSGHVLILHWFCHNCVKSSHKKDTLYHDEKALVTLDKQGVYHLKNEDENSGILGSKEKEIKEKKSKEKREVAAAADACGASLSDKESNFNLFWESYPNKQDRLGAFKAFMNIDTPVETLLAALERHKQLPHWVNDSGAFIPRAENWLRKRRWEDELVTAPLPDPKRPPCGAIGQLGAEELAAIQSAMSEEL